MNDNKSMFIPRACVLRRSVTVNYAAASLLTLLLAGCVPRIEVAAPTAPITINIERQGGTRHHNSCR